MMLESRSGGELRLSQLQQLQSELQGLEGRRGSSEQSALMMRDEFDDDVLPCLVLQPLLRIKDTPLYRHRTVDAASSNGPRVAQRIRSLQTLII